MTSGPIFRDLGPALRTLRRERGLSQVEIARAAGLTASSVSRYESGKVLPKLTTLGEILRALDANATTLAVALQAAQGREAFEAESHPSTGLDRAALAICAAAFVEYLAAVADRFDRTRRDSARTGADAPHEAT